MLKNKFTYHIVLALVLSTAGIGLLLLINHYSINHANETASQLQKKQNDIEVLRKVLIDLQNIETGQRGYVLTNDEHFLSSYEQGRASLKADTIMLLNNYENKDYKEDIEAIMMLVRAKIQHSSTVINIQTKFGSDSARLYISRKIGLTLMDQIRQKINDLETNHESILSDFSQKIFSTSKENQQNYLLLGSLIFITIIISLFIIRNDYKKLSVQNQLLSFQNTLIGNISDAIISTDENYIILDWNNHATCILGYEKQEAIGKNLFTLLKIESSDTPLEAIVHAFKEKHRWRGELINIHKNGTKVYVDISASAILDSQRKITGTVSVVRDITKQKEDQIQLQLLTNNLEKEIKIKINQLTESNHELLKTRERFQLISNATNECIWDWDMKTNEIWGNIPYMQLLGKQAGDTIRYDEFLTHVPQEDANRIGELFANAVENKEHTFSSNFRFIKNNGDVLHFTSKSYIVYDETGNPVRGLGGLTDVTIQQKIQSQIIKEKEISEQLINSLPGVFYMFNKTGKYLKWNQNVLNVTGYSAEEFKELHPIQFVPEESRLSLIDKINNVFEKGNDSIEADFLTKDGKRIPYYFTGSKITIDDEDCLMGIGYDLTEKLHYQNQLKELASHLQSVREEEQKRISREIHDQLGQQLTGIKMMLAAIKKNKKLNDEIKLTEVMELVDDTLNSVRKISTNLRPSMLDDLGLLAAIEWLLEDCKKKYDIACVFETNINQGDIDADTSSTLFRICQESITNVIRHAKATLIQVDLKIIEKQLLLTIKDDGIGIDSKNKNIKTTLGIIGMKERAESIHAVFSLNTIPEQGTTVSISKKLA